MDSIFLKNQKIQKGLVEPTITSIESLEQLEAVAEYIRGKNFINLRNGDYKLCRKINGEIAEWINNNTNSAANLWLCSPYPNLHNKDAILEHVVCVVTSVDRRYIVDATAGQTTISDKSIFVREINPEASTNDELSSILGGDKWQAFTSR